MPSCSNYLLLPKRAISVFQIQRFIPKKWKQTSVVSETQNKYHPPTTSSSSSSSSSCTSSSSSSCSSHKEILLEEEEEEEEEETSTSDDCMVDSILTSLKDFASQGHLSKAFRTFSLIQCHVSTTTTTTTSSNHLTIHSLSYLLLCCTNLKSFPQGQQIHAQAISLGLQQHSVLVPKLVSFYSAFNRLVDSHFITENSNIIHPLPWNLLISSYVRNGFFVNALSAYSQMVSKGIRPDNFTYPSVLKACGEEQNLGFGREVHKSIDTTSNEWSLFVHNALVSMYSRCGEVEIARDLFDKMLERDAVSWNSMISGYASKGMWARAFELFETMRAEGIEVNIITWNTIAGGCLRTGNYKGALELLSQMRTCGIHLDPVATIIGLGACSHIGMLKLGKEIHGISIRNFWDGYDNVRNALVTMYSRCRDLRHAYILFRLRENTSVITWNSIISGFTYWDQSKEASFLFREMLLSGVEPNFVTIASILPLCARVPNLRHGKEFHCYITRREGFEDHLLLWNALVDMYARSGKISNAKRLFDLLSKKDEVTYTSLIAGYGMEGEGQAALKLFYEMIRFRIKPDHVTMVAVLTACSHSGLVSQGQMIFEKMPSVYGITPRLEHFACMIDLFGRAGLLKTAEEIIRKMPYPPTPAMWVTLIGACRKHGNTEIGEWAAEKLLEMRPENPGYYVLISNMYAAAGCWNKLAKVRTLMRDLGVRKAPGCAWVNAGTGFSPFSVADTSNSKADEIYPLLGCLTKQMKEADYVATEDFGVEEEDLEESLSVSI